MDQELSTPTGESPYDHASDNPAYERDTGEQTTVDIQDMPPPPEEPVNDIANDVKPDVVDPGTDVVVDPEDEIAANMDTEPAAVVEVIAVNGDGDVVDHEDGMDVETPDGVVLPEYSYSGESNGPVDEEAGPLPSKSQEDPRYESIISKTTDMTMEDIERDRQKSIKICLGLFVVVLIGLAVGLVGFYISYSARAAISTTPRPTTEATAPATAPPIQIDYIGAVLNVTFRDRNFTLALYDSSSTEYQELVAEITMLIEGILQSGNYSNGTTTVLEVRPGSIVVVIVISFDSVPGHLVGVLIDGGTDALLVTIGNELVAELTDGLSSENVDVELSDVVFEEPTTVVATTTGTTTEPTIPTAASTVTPETTPKTTPETTPTEETTTSSTTPQVTCASDEFTCDEEGSCIGVAEVCDFVPDCTVSRADETENLCEVSFLTEDISVTARRNATLTTPVSYPSRFIDTPLDYILYRLTSPADTHLLIDIFTLEFDGPESVVTIGTGHEPVQAHYYRYGIIMRYQMGWQYPTYFPTPGDEAFILVGKAKTESIQIDIRISLFNCMREGAIPCRYIAQCYLPSEACDGVAQCQFQEDEYNCPNPDQCFNCTTLWGDEDVCLPTDWMCDGTQDCVDNSDESDLICPKCFDCPSMLECVLDPEWVCNGIEDCDGGEDEDDDICSVMCPNGEFPCTWSEGICINSIRVCDFVPDCRDSRADEPEDRCMVSMISKSIHVPFEQYRTLRSPVSYLPRNISDISTTPNDYLLYRLSSPLNSHLLIEVITVSFNGTNSLVEIGSGSDPVEAFYSNNVLLTYSAGEGYDGSKEPIRRSSLGNEAYILLNKAPLDDIDFFFRISSFQCTRDDDIPCSQSNHCYLESELCDGIVQCVYSEEDEECASPIPDPCHYCNTSRGDDVCLPFSWVCDGRADCLDASDEADCPQDCYPCNSTICVYQEYLCDGFYDCFELEDEVDECNGTVDSACFPCHSSELCVIYDWVCDGEVDCYRGEDEANCLATSSPPPPDCFTCESNYDCVPLNWVCDREVDCVDGEDEMNCVPGNSSCFFCENSSDCISWDLTCDGYYDCYDTSDERNCNGSTPNPECFECYSTISSCIPQHWTCDEYLDCRDGSDERGCDNSSEPHCFQCASDPFQCVHLHYQCDNYADCDDGSDELNCACCYFDNDICLNETSSCDETYDCPGGTDEFNCTGCFSCDGASACLIDLQVCDFIRDCPQNEDESEDLCSHSDFIRNYEIQVGEWMAFSDGFARQRHLGNRHTPASNFYDFTHFVFQSANGSTLFMEIQNLKMNLTGPLSFVARITAGSGTDPTDLSSIRMYADAFGNLESISNSGNFTLSNNTGYLLIAIPKSVYGIFSLIFRVTAIECESPEVPCYGSLHCLNRKNDICDNTTQCLDSGEDEFGCEECFHGSYCFFEDKCYLLRDECNAVYDCASGIDESNCPGCNACNGTAWCPDDILVCDYFNDCPNGDDEAESLCNHTAFINEINLSPGQSVTIERSWLDYEERSTPASRFFNFTHYVFTSPPGTALFIEIQNITVDGEPGPLSYLFRIVAGAGSDPSSVDDNEAHFGLYYNSSISHSNNFSVSDSVGHLLVAIPKDVQAYFTFRVTAVECESPSEPCIGSPHCWVFARDRCDDEIDCPYSNEDEHACLPVFNCTNKWNDNPVFPSHMICDGFEGCTDGSDEWFCNIVSPACDLQCSYGDTCVGSDRVCNNIYDCPGGVDEYNCEGCFTCSGSDYCLNDIHVCDFYDHCPGDEDESELLCRHSEFIKNKTVPSGEWVNINFTSGSMENRDTLAGNFIEFTHYVFRGDPGTTLFMELQNYTWSSGPLVSALRIYAGIGDDPTNRTSILAYLDGTGYNSTISNSTNFSLRSDTGYALFGIPKGISASLQLRVTAIECASNSTYCLGSPHCYDPMNEICDGTVQCVNSEEDEESCDRK